MVTFSKEDIITTDKYLDLSSNRIVYLKTDLIYKGLESMIWRGKLHKIQKGDVWITGHSAYCIDSKLFNKYSSNCTYWFATNKNFKHDNFFAVPVGITNNTTETGLHPIYGNIDIMIETMNMPRNIKNLVYMNFNIRTYPQERQECYDMFKDKDWVTKGVIDNTINGRRRFLMDLRNHKFVLCPRGMGIDTHRLWETLYMGSIPVVLKTLALEEFSDLPILFVDSWNDINENMLEKKYNEMGSRDWNMDKLKIDYWRQKITDASLKCSAV